MARPRKPNALAPSERPRLIRPFADADGLVRAQLARGHALRDGPIESWDDLKDLRARYYTWVEYVKELLLGLFTTAEPANEFAVSPRFAYSLGGPVVLTEEIDDFRRDVGVYTRRLDSLLERMPLFVTEAEGQGGGAVASPSEVARRLFIVHGHDREPVDVCVRLLRDQGLYAVVLDEQPNKGRTIIEKFEEHTDVAYAIVLMTPDDVGGVAGTSAKGLAPRSRQNVILELGFFIGKLGRHNVAALVAEGVEIPSDIDGILYIPLDPGRSWRFRLAQELRAAGLPLDLNLL